MSERLEMTVKFQVTVSQALALQAMFEHWNKLAGWGCSRVIGFFVDGDGNFHPHCEWGYSQALPELTDELRKAAHVNVREPDTDMDFDFDGIAWKVELPEPPEAGDE